MTKREREATKQSLLTRSEALTSTDIGMSLEEVSQRLNIPKTTVRRLENSALHKLRQHPNFQALLTELVNHQRKQVKDEPGLDGLDTRTKSQLSEHEVQSDLERA